MTYQVSKEVHDFLKAGLDAERRYNKNLLRQAIANGEWGAVTSIVIQLSPLMRRIDHETMIFGGCNYTKWEVEKNASWTFRYLARLRGERL